MGIDDQGTGLSEEDVSVFEEAQLIPDFGSGLHEGEIILVTDRFDLTEDTLLLFSYCKLEDERTQPIGTVKPEALELIQPRAKLRVLETRGGMPTNFELVE